MSNFNRESWLTELAQRLERAVFGDFRLSPYRLTCGWPSKNATGRRYRRVGECHALCNSSGNLHELFISPVLAEPVEVAGVVCHEMAHIAAGVGAGHGKSFQAMCRHVGLSKGRATSAMPGPALEKRVRALALEIGSYPHQAMHLPQREFAARSQRPSVSLTCAACGCRISMQRSWLEEYGAPLCSCGAGPFPFTDDE